jgi:hypothetical protein
MNAFLNPENPRTTHYGAIMGIIALGPQIIQILLFEPLYNSNLLLFTKYLIPELKSQNLETNICSNMCYNALMNASFIFLTFLSKNFKEKEFNLKKFEIENDEENEKIIETLEKNLDSKKNFNERIIDFNIPEDINLFYYQLYDLFGETIIPYINYDIFQSGNSINFYNFFL